MSKINPADLWVGDRLILLKSQRTGLFQGIKNGKIRVKVDNSIVISSIDNIALAPEQKSNPALDSVNKEFKTSSLTKSNIFLEKQSFNDTIDLHIEKLQASKQHDPPVAIVEFQIRKLKEFIEKAIRLKCAKVHIIHGKGTGALKMEAEHLVKSYDEFVSIYPINDGGGMTVYLA